MKCSLRIHFKILFQTKISPNCIAVVEVLIQASNAEEIITAQLTVSSEYEKLTIPVRASVAHGSLKIIPGQVILHDCFPVSF